MSVKSKLTALAEAIRESSPSTSKMKISEMIAMLASIKKTETIKTLELLNRTIKTYSISNSVISIGGSAFSNCDLLESIAIPDSVTSIGSQAFSRCSSLISVNIPYRVEWINANVFEYCTSLKTVTISIGVTYISYRAFKDCVSLKTIEIPKSIQKIEDNAFEGCNSLTDIYCNFAEGAVDGAPWGAPQNVNIHYNT